MLNDLWLWRDGDWHDVSHVGTKTPPARCLTAMAACTKLCVDPN